jgi:hypothetical protein
MDDANSLLNKSVEFRKEGKDAESLGCLARYFMNNNSLLWFAKLSNDPGSSAIAADLALKLEPENEMAQRAIISIKNQLPEKTTQQDELVKCIVGNTGLTLNQALSVKWPFKGVNRPIGEAIEFGNINLRDLAWASENAYDEQIQNAAKTVLLSRLLKAKFGEIPAVPKIIIGSRYSEKQERMSLLFDGALTGFVMAIGIIPGLAIIGSYFKLIVLRLNFLILILIFLIMLLGVRLSHRLTEKAIRYKMGRRGEEKAVENFLYSFDGRWFLIRNFVWKYRKWGDVDLILIGPGGVWVFEVKAFSGKIRNLGNRWQKKGKFWWYDLPSNPGRQARRNAARVKEYLSENGIPIKWVTPVVIWAGDLSPLDEEKGHLTLENPETPVWKAEEIDKHIDEFMQHINFADKVNDAVAVFTREIETYEKNK